jgi:ABC-type Fe3+/spermidine/putrescine transport system ATPase subunit
LAVLELENVVKKYGEVLGVGPVSFRTKEGEFLSLLGPSGCGRPPVFGVLGVWRI